MKKVNLTHYIARLCTIAREKSLLGEEAEAAEYFYKAINFAKEPEHFICISAEIYRADLNDNKIIAYFSLLEAFNRSEYPVKLFKKLFFRINLIPLISEFLMKMPDHMFHYLLEKAKDDSESEFLASVFLPFSHLISDPDPEMILNKQYKNAS